MTAAPTAPVPPETPGPRPDPSDAATPASVAYSGLQGPSGDGDPLAATEWLPTNDGRPHIHERLAADLDQPTWWAYNAACKALDAHRERANRAEAQLAAVTTERDQLREAGDELHGWVQAAWFGHHERAGHPGEPDECDRTACPAVRTDLARWREVAGR